MALVHEVLATESGGEAVTPPRRKTTFTRAAGAVLVAAVLGAAVLVASGYASGRHVGTSAGSNDFNYLQLTALSDACHASLKRLEKLSTEEQRNTHARSHDIECGAEEKVCKWTLHTYAEPEEQKFTYDNSMCLPKHKCKSHNIRTEIEGGLNNTNLKNLATRRRTITVSLALFQCDDDDQEYDANGKPDCNVYCKKKWSSSTYEVSGKLYGTAPHCRGGAHNCQNSPRRAEDRVVFGKSASSWSTGRSCWVGKKACCCVLHNGKQDRLLLSNHSHSL